MATRFSIVVPVAVNGALPIAPSLDALDYPRDHYEVLVERGANPSRNRNRAIARASGDVVAFVDADCIVPPDWLRAADAFLTRQPAWDVVGGPQLTPATDGFFGRVSGYVLASRFGAGRMSARYRRDPVDLHATESSLSSANLFVRRAVFERVGLFDPRLWPNEETELLRRIERGRGRIAHDPAIVVFHHRRPGLRTFAAQCFGYGRGRARQVTVSGERPSLSVLLPSAFLVFVLALPMLLWLHPLWAVPVALYGATTLLWSAGTAAVRGDAAALGLLPLVFATIHVAYPAGYLSETFRLWLGGGVEPRGADDEVLVRAASS